MFKGTDPALDDELNRRAWGATLPPLRAQPGRPGPGPLPALRRLSRRRGLIADPPPVATYAVDLFEEAEPMTAYVAEGVDRIRRAGPLVHNVTNLVAMTLSANVLIAAGASPIMSAAPEEAGDLAGLSGALVVNIGTLTRDWIEGAHAAVRGARIAGRPWVLDPVGVGATAFRRDTARALIAQRRGSSAATPRRSWPWPAGPPAARASTARPAAEAAAEAARALASGTGAWSRSPVRSTWSPTAAVR